ncbi:MAG: tetratricopeptide repeat protein, partial [Planctomycetes bacterium]|nr:tetratricopeptide repeat protein [Planctomycetota bacterium]
SEIYLNLGRLDVAEKMARQAVAHADVSEDWFQMLGQRTYLANVLHQLGRSDEAEQLFIEAERQQSSSSPGYRHLYSVQGFWYCDLLLAERRVPEVLQRAHDALRIATMRARPLEIALDSLTLARAYMATEPTNREAAEPHLRDALSHLRKAGNEDEIPRGLLARATFHRLADDLSSAMKDLDAAQKLCRRHDLRLFEADVALERARCQLAAGERADAGATLSVARELIAAMNYGRYRSELTRLQAELAG